MYLYVCANVEYVNVCEFKFQKKAYKLNENEHNKNVFKIMIIKLLIKIYYELLCKT